jgi:shikimate dehydrogenase
MARTTFTQQSAPPRFQFGLIGRSLQHSFSARYFQRLFALQELFCQYNNYPIETIDALSQIFQQTPRLVGLNVTVPYKKAVIPYLTALSPGAQSLGAVNTIACSPQGRRQGYNTDVIGFRDDLKDFIGANVQAVSRALILGTGGSAAAVAYSLRNDFGLAELRFVSRSPRSSDQIGYEELTPALLANYPLIVQCTPVGMYPAGEERPALPYEALGPAHWLYDLVYNPEQTAFLSAGAAQGAHTRNGRGMLYGQARAAWRIWQEWLPAWEGYQQAVERL